MADFKVVDAEQLESDLKVVADAIREKGGTSEKLEFPNGMADAVRGIQSGGSIPHLLDITEYTHAEDWLVTSIGNAEAFANFYCNREDTTDRNLYICYVENNNVTGNNANYMMFQRNSDSSFSSVNYRKNWTNVATNAISSRDFFVARGAKVTVIRFKVGE